MFGIVINLSFRLFLLLEDLEQFLRTGKLGWWCLLKIILK